MATEIDQDDLCVCGDRKEDHKDGTGECQICKWNPSVPGPEGYCKEFRPVSRY